MDRHMSEWRRRQEEAAAEERPETFAEFFAPENVNRPVRRREFLSLVDFAMKRWAMRRWYWRALHGVQRFLKGRQTVVVVQAPPAAGEAEGPPSSLIQP
jgi:hypothetical protein